MSIGNIEEEYRFNYIWHGDRTQPIILFLHGFMGDCRDFEAVINHLPEFCCLTVDLPGHGLTEVERDSRYQMANTARGLIQLLRELEIDSCILVGYSMGGRIALYLTINFPHFFRGTVLESASPGLATQSARDRRIDWDLQLSERLTTSDLTSFLASWYANPLFDSFRNHPRYQAAITRRLQNNPARLAKSLQNIGLGRQPSLWGRLAAIDRSLLLIVGDKDYKFTEIAQKMLCSLPDASLSVVQNSGHNVHFEQPREFSQLLKDFILDCQPKM